MALPQLFVLGDSISIHYGPALERMTAGRWRYDRKRNGAGIATDLEGANGGDSNCVRLYLEARLAKGEWKPDLLLLNCGLHDIKIVDGKKQVPVEAYRRNLESVLGMLRKKGIPLIWVRTTPVDEEMHNARHTPKFLRFSADVEEYNRAADEVMSSGGVPIADLFFFTCTLGSGEELFCDHVHYREEVREKQAAFLAGFLAGWHAKG